MFIVGLIIFAFLVVSCATKMTDEEVSAGLDDLSDGELEAVGQQESSLAGQAFFNKMPAKKQANIKQVNKVVKRVTCNVVGNQVQLTALEGDRQLYSRNIPLFSCESNNAITRGCLNDRLTSTPMACEFGCDASTGRCIEAVEDVENLVPAVEMRATQGGTQYELTFTNRIGQRITLPLFSESTNDYGSQDDLLRWDNSMQNEQYAILNDDIDLDSVTHIIQYKGADNINKADPKMKFKILGTGEAAELPIDFSRGYARADLNLRGTTYTFTNLNDTRLDQDDFAVHTRMMNTREWIGTLGLLSTQNGLLSITLVSSRHYPRNKFIKIQVPEEPLVNAFIYLNSENNQVDASLVTELDQQQGRYYFPNGAMLEWTQEAGQPEEFTIFYPDNR